MDAATERVIGAIHSSGRQAVFEFAGAGSVALAQLHAVAGSSRTVLEATDRYAPSSLADLLGAVPEKIVDPAAAAAMADRAYLRAARLGDDRRPRIGVACTATIATNRQKRGDHRCCVAVRDGRSMATFDVVLIKGRRDRDQEEHLVAAMVIHAIAAACEVADAPPPALLDGETLRRQQTPLPDPVDRLFAGGAQWLLVHAGGLRDQSPVCGIVYSGSFDPLHFGHEAMASAAARVLGAAVYFEITAINAEKSPLGRAELERRLAQFWRRYPIAVSRAPLFSQKAVLYPGCTFLVGYDTAIRLVDPRFYGGSSQTRDQSLSEIAARGCRVMVAGRMAEDRFKTLADVPIPAGFEQLFFELPAREFRADISATELRVARNS